VICGAGDGCRPSPPLPPKPLAEYWSCRSTKGLSLYPHNELSLFSDAIQAAETLAPRARDGETVDKDHVFKETAEKVLRKLGVCLSACSGI
jgi:hypothetical protein